VKSGRPGRGMWRRHPNTPAARKAATRRSSVERLPRGFMPRIISERFEGEKISAILVIMSKPVAEAYPILHHGQQMVHKTGGQLQRQKLACPDVLRAAAFASAPPPLHSAFCSVRAAIPRSDFAAFRFSDNRCHHSIRHSCPECFRGCTFCILPFPRPGIPSFIIYHS